MEVAGDSGMSHDGSKVPPDFRELYHTESWGADFILPQTSKVDFKTRLTALSKTKNIYFSGYLTQDNEGGLHYHLTRNTRSDLSAMPGLMAQINSEFGVNGSVEEAGTEPEFRVVFGLEEGYSENIKRGVLKQIEKGEITSLEQARQELREKLPDIPALEDLVEAQDLVAFQQKLAEKNLAITHTQTEVASELSGQVVLQGAEIFGAQPPNEYLKSGGNYSEPAVVITGNMKFLMVIYRLAEKFNQQRIIVEDLKNKKIWVVETSKLVKS